jgi:hypothetical protein
MSVGERPEIRYSAASSRQSEQQSKDSPIILIRLKCRLERAYYTDIEILHANVKRV